MWHGLEGGGFKLPALTPVFKIEVFNVLRTRFGPAECASLKTTLQYVTIS